MNFRQNLQIQRKSILLLVLGPIFLLYFLCLTYHDSSELSKTEEKINFLHKKFVLAKLQKEKETIFLNKLKTASPHYIDQQIEAIAFAHSDKRLRFVEGEIRRSKTLQEVEEKQESPLIVNEGELKKILTLVEGVTISPHQPSNLAPQLLFQSFDLKKVAISPHENLFEVNMNLIKREGLR